MDFDSFITFLFILAFFILPSILKQIQARKKKKTVSKIRKKKPSFFNRIGDQIQQFVRDLEAQAQQQKKASMDQETAWESLADDNARHSGVETMGEDADFKVAKRRVPEKKTELEVIEPQVRRQPPAIGSSKAAIEGSAHLVSAHYRFKSNPLQNAVIWSEVLSKPVALREDKTGG